jgi:GMP synthase-like glutamine amidotransferase
MTAGEAGSAPLRAQVFQHVPFEASGCIGDWLAAAGARVGTTHWHADAELPSLADVDLLVVMGGPMSANDEATLPWLVAEKRFIREAIEAGKPVVGVCLGAQLIAAAMGGRVYPNAEKEIGWFPLYAVPATAQTPLFSFPAQARVFHWHGETFDLPAGATRLARSDACANQAFQLGRRVIGMQFHLETTADSACALVENLADEMVPGRYVQDAAGILAAGESDYRRINALMADVLRFVTAP